MHILRAFTHNNRVEKCIKFDKIMYLWYNCHVFFVKKERRNLLIMKSELKAKVIAFVCTALVLSCGIIKNNIFNDSKKQVERNQILAMESYTTYDIENDVNSFINDNYETFEFYANTFGITLDNLEFSFFRLNK